jgi:hypothetical protein
MSARQAFLAVLATLAVCASVFGAFIGWVVYAMAESADGNYDGTVSTVRTVQLILGWVGIVPAAAMAYFVFRESNRKAAATLAIGLIVWAGWAVLNDAAVHGWRNMVLLHPFS